MTRVLLDKATETLQGSGQRPGNQVRWTNATATPWMPRGRASRFSTPCGSIPASVAGLPALAGMIDDPDVAADVPARDWRTMGARGHHSMRRRTLLGTALAMANASPL